MGMCVDWARAWLQSIKGSHVVVGFNSSLVHVSCLATCDFWRPLPPALPLPAEVFSITCCCQISVPGQPDVARGSQVLFISDCSLAVYFPISLWLHVL